MIQCRRRARLASEALQGLRIAGEFRRQKFQRHAAPERLVLRFVHHAHAATTELSYHAVVRNGLTNHAFG
jgi:hypothetical protein